MGIFAQDSAEASFLSPVPQQSEELRKNLPFVSIAIITLNSGSTLEECLMSIEALDYPRDRYEVVVVDGGSSDGTMQILRKFPVRVIVDFRKNRGVARNVAVENCRGQLIVFTDGDCTPFRSWLKDHVSLQLDPKVLVVAGSVLQGGDFSLPASIYHGTYFATQSPATSRRKTWEIATCNASFKRSSFSIVGPFQELDRGEESMLCWKILQAGYDVVFDPTPKVLHLHKPMNFMSLLRRSREEGYSDRVLQAVFGTISPFRLPRKLIVATVLTPSLVIARLGRYYTKLVMSGYRRTAVFALPMLVAATLFWVTGYLEASHQRVAE